MNLLTFGVQVPVIRNPLPLNRDYSRDAKIEALKRRGAVNHGSTFIPTLPPTKQIPKPLH